MPNERVYVCGSVLFECVCVCLCDLMSNHRPPAMVLSDKRVDYRRSLGVNGWERQEGG